jgi:hypothetical protein
MFGLSINNIGKKSNQKWKMISKFLCRSLPLYVGIIAAIPGEYINPQLKVWLSVALSTLVATISSLSELSVEENKG